MADFKTFLNLITDCENALKVPDSSKRELIKEMINMVYLNEILTVDDLYPLFWLLDFDDTLASKAPATITGISQADPGVFTASHDYVVGDIVSVYSIGTGPTELNNRTFKINTVPSAGATLTLIDLDGLDAINTTSLTAWSSGGVINHRGLTLATTGKNVQRILSPAWHDQDGAMTMIDEESLEKDPSYWGSSTSLPDRYLHRKTYTATGTETNQLLWFYAASAANDLRYWMEKRASVLSTDGNVPLLPPQFHPMIVSGVLTRLASVGVQVENQSIWPALYQEQLGQLRSFNRKWHRRNKHFLKP